VALESVPLAVTMKRTDIGSRSLAQVIRAAVESGASVMFGRFRNRIRLSQASNVRLCVNLGSAYRAPDDWLNLDRSINVLIDRVPGLATVLHAVRLLSSEQLEHMRRGHWRAVHFWDAHYPIPIVTSSADFIYTSHFLEHLDIATADYVLRECWRVLKPGGIVRVVVPDMFLMSEQYASTMRKLAATESTASDLTVFLSTPMRVDEVSEAFTGQFFERTLERQRLFGHRWMFDRWSLQRALERAGFTGITEMPYQQGSLPDLTELDCRPSNSLHMEGRKVEQGT